MSATQEHANIRSLLFLHNLLVLQSNAAGLDASANLQLIAEATKDIAQLFSIIDKLKLFQALGGVDVSAQLFAPLRPVLSYLESILEVNLNKLMTSTVVSRPGFPSPG